MIKRNNQSGFGVVEVIVIVVVLGIGVALGWVGYSKLKPSTTTASKTSPAASTTSTTTPTTPMTTGSMDSGFPVTLSWTYPQSWTLTKSGKSPTSSSESSDQTVTLTSPSQAYTVVYKLAQNEGFGGTCDTSAATKIRYITRQTPTNFSKAVFVQSITDTLALVNGEYAISGYTYQSRLMQSTDEVMSAAVGDNECKVTGQKGAFQVYSNPSVYLMGASIYSKNIDKTDQYGDIQPIKDMATIKAQYDTAEYKDAVKILLSTQMK